MSDISERVYNFSAGPSILPVEVLQEAAADMLNWKGAGMGVMEMSHRGKAYQSIIDAADADVRQLMGIPANYKVLFLQGGASLQFTMAPMNLLHAGETADYIVTGAWSKKAMQAGKLVGNVNVVWDGKEANYNTLPDLTQLNYTDKAAFTCFTSNETIHGVEFQNDVTLKGTVVCDMSSDILSRPVDVSKYALIFAGAQKNMGPAGVTLVIIREDLLEKTPENMHPMLDYKLQAENGSMYNTPNCWGIYICGLVYKHLLKNGGLPAMNARNKEKAAIVYKAIDESGGFYKGHSVPQFRSIMNITFTLPNDDVSAKFVSEAKALKLDGLKGHRSVGGCRASVYNAFPKEGCVALAQFMKEFAAKNG